MERSKRKMNKLQEKLRKAAEKFSQKRLFADDQPASSPVLPNLAPHIETIPSSATGIIKNDGSHDSGSPQKTQEKIKNPETKISDAKIPEEKKSETKNPETKNFSCPVCHSLEVWLPRVAGVDAEDPVNWRCWTCKPPPNPTLVKARRGPSVDAPAVEGVESSVWKPDLSTCVVAEEVPHCARCLGSWVVETPDARGSLQRSCYTCRGPVVGPVELDRPPSNGHWRNPFALFLKDRQHAQA